MPGVLQASSGGVCILCCEEVKLVTSWVLVNELMRLSVGFRVWDGRGYRMLRGLVGEFVRRFYTVDPDEDTVRVCYERLSEGSWARCTWPPAWG